MTTPTQTNSARLEGAAAGTDQASTPDQLNPAAILELSMSFFASRTLLSAVGMGLFTVLADGPLDRHEVSQRLGLHRRGADDFLDALVALGLLERKGGRYANTPTTAAFLDRHQPGYVGGLLEMMDARLYRIWDRLGDALRSGQPQNEAEDGSGAFEAIYADRQRLRGFAKAMTASALGPARAIAETFPFERYETLLDIGTAEGALPVAVALAHQHITGAGYDLPPLGPLFDEYVTSFGVQQRLRFHPGDFWQDELPPADIVVLGRVLHDWDTAEKLTLLQKAHAALPTGGALIVHELFIDDDRRRNAAALLMSLNMLVETPGGSNFTAAECRSWLRATGFRETWTQALGGPDGIVVGIK